MSHPLVIDCAAVGLYSEKESCWLPTGFVMVTNTIVDLRKTKDEILEIISQLADEKQLRGGLFMIKDLPRTSTGKVDRRLLCQHTTIQ